MKNKPIHRLNQLVLMSVLSMGVPNVWGGGIPVFDATAIAQQIEQVVSWGKQLKAMQQQFDQQVKEFESMTGQRGFGNVLNDPKLRQFLPTEWKNIYDTVNAKQPLSQALGLERDQHVKAYEAATQEQVQIQGLIEQINQADDPKAISELQARIAGEQSKIQNTLVQLQLNTQLAEIQNKLVKQTKRETFIKETQNEIGKPIAYPEPITNWE